MKVYAHPPNEDWICDRMCNEFFTHNSEYATKNFVEADVIWLLSDWCWKQVPLDLLATKPVVTTVHHIVPSKFGINEQNDFRIRDSITNHYHCFNTRTADFISKYTTKEITIIPYWINLEYWKCPEIPLITARNEARTKLNLPLDAFIISSFQRDTEGSDLKSPKLEKGPDFLCDAIEDLVATKRYDNIQVLLGGWRRQYVINRLVKAKIPYHYFELTDLDTIKNMYQASSLYLVTARCEGGPQSILEAASLKVPLVSRPVGIAEQILAKRSINEDVTKAIPNIEHAYQSVVKLDRNIVFPQYIDFFKRIINVK